MNWEFQLLKMDAEADTPVQYFLDINDDYIITNELINRKISLEHTGYQCKICGSDEPVFRMGMCKKCFFESPYAGDWIVHPELSRAHLGEEDRNLDVEKRIQLQPHYVYLAKTSDVKIGVTRKEQVPNRWIDQGADEVIVIMETPNRYLAGITEMTLKKYINDKTQWRKMLTPEISTKDLYEVFEKIKNHVPPESQPYFLSKPEVFEFTYPVEKYPQKIKSVKLDKTKKISGKLIGIKGQYLLFDDGRVFNVRNHEGYIVKMEI